MKKNITMKTLTIVLLLSFFFLNGFSQGELTAYSKEKNKPIAEYKVGDSKVVVWENKKPNGETWKSYQIKKIYKKDDKWQNTTSFKANELLQLKEAIEKAIKEDGIKPKEIPNKKE